MVYLNALMSDQYTVDYPSLINKPLCKSTEGICDIAESVTFCFDKIRAAAEGGTILAHGCLCGEPLAILRNGCCRCSFGVCVAAAFCRWSSHMTSTVNQQQVTTYH